MFAQVNAAKESSQAGDDTTEADIRDHALCDESFATDIIAWTLQSLCKRIHCILRLELKVLTSNP